MKHGIYFFSANLGGGVVYNQEESVPALLAKPKFMEPVKTRKSKTTHLHFNKTKIKPRE